MPNLKDNKKIFLLTLLCIAFSITAGFSASADDNKKQTAYMYSPVPRVIERKVIAYRPKIPAPVGQIDAKSAFFSLMSFPYEALLNTVKELSSPKYAGRKSGTPQNMVLAKELAQIFSDLGLQAYNGKWLWEFEQGTNVMACLPGTTGKWVVVCAYYDGLGLDSASLLHYPGADSNASGVAMMMELAKRFSCGHEFKRDGIIFVALDGHSLKYRGAENLSSLLKKQEIRLVINLDIVGNGLVPIDKRRPRYLMALGAEKYSKSLSSCARWEKIELYYEYYRSESFTNLFYRKIGDQTIFLKQGIPCVVFTSGITDHTNKLTDTYDTLDYSLLRDRSLLIYRWIGQRFVW